jgi:hypothetical protein
VAATAATLARARDDLVRVVHRSSGLPEFARDLGRTLQRAVPFEGVCLLTVDPATLLPTGEIVQNGLPQPARIRLTEIELGGAGRQQVHRARERPGSGRQPQRGDRR